MPRRTCGMLISAWGAATRRSVARRISVPPPMARPLTAAITGMCSASNRWKTVRARRITSRSSSLVVSWAYRLTSPPVQKNRLPAPVTINARRLASPSILSRISRKAWLTSALSEFPASGRSMVRTSALPRRSCFTTSAKVFCCKTAVDLWFDKMN